MKLVLTNFSTDVSLTGQDGQSYVVFRDEESQRTFRLPAPQEMLVRLSQILEGEYAGEPPMPGEEYRPQQDELASYYGAIEEPEKQESSVPDEEEPLGTLGDPNVEPEEEEPAPEPAPVKKKMGLPPATGPMRLTVSKLREQMNRAGPTAESKVPSL